MLRGGVADFSIDMAKQAIGSSAFILSTYDARQTRIETLELQQLVQQVAHTFRLTNDGLNLAVEYSPFLIVEFFSGDHDHGQ